jgi:hypothetical protein
MKKAPPTAPPPGEGSAGQKLRRGASEPTGFTATKLPGPGSPDYGRFDRGATRIWKPKGRGG